MESYDSIDKSWDTTSDLTTTTALRSDPLASENAPSSGPGGWMVNVTGRDIVEMSHADVLAKWQKGELVPSTLVWREGMETWSKLETVPAFELAPEREENEEPTAPGEANAVVYERPMATLVFDEAVEEEWKAPPQRESSKSARASESSKSSRSVSGRPVAPNFPSFAPRKNPSAPAAVAPARSASAPVDKAPSRPVSVPADEPPPPPPLPSRSPPKMSARPAPTIPGGLAPPSPRPSSAPMIRSTPPASASVSKNAAPNKPLTLSSLPAKAPAQSSPPANRPPLQNAAPAASLATENPPPTKNPPPVAPASSPLLAAIAAAATSPEPVVVAAPVSSSVGESDSAVFDELSISARLRAMKSVSLRSAVLACAGSALLASLLTGLVVGSRSRPVARSEEPSIKTAAPVTAAPPPVTPPVAAPAPSPTAVAAAPAETAAPSKPESVATSEPEVVEKPKPKVTKVVTWKPPKPVAAAESGENERPAPNPERDDPERAVPDRVEDPSNAQPATWQANPGF